MKINFYERVLLQLERKIRKLEKEKQLIIDQCPHCNSCLMFECPIAQARSQFFEKISS